MNIVILMAGEGSRFKDVGYPLPKPLIEVGDKHILEWTTRSLPFISHYDEKPTKNVKLYFAIRTEHEKQFQMSAHLKRIYGEKIKIKLFDELTRGNLETAFLTCQDIDNDDETLILDSDNHYDGSRLLDFLQMFKGRFPDFASICYFEPIDQSSKWCFAMLKGNGVEDLREKDEQALSMGGKPMVGVFYYNSKNLFMDVAKFILAQKEEVKGEFYMSQTMKYLVDNGIPVFGLKVGNVKPLGTPQDIINVRDVEYENLH